MRELRIGGLDVYAVARSAGDLTALAEETGCEPLALDISHRDAVMGLLGSLDADVLINNASSTLARSTASWETAPADIDALLDVNLGGDYIYPIADALVARGVPWMFVTGYDGWSLPEAYRQATVVAKPFSMAVVVDSIARLFAEEPRR